MAKPVGDANMMVDGEAEGEENAGSGSVGSGLSIDVSGLAAQVRTLAERLNGKSWKTVRKELLALAGACE